MGLGNDLALRTEFKFQNPFKDGCGNLTCNSSALTARWEAETEFLGAGEPASLEYVTINNQELAPNMGANKNPHPSLSSEVLWHKINAHITHKK